MAQSTTNQNLSIGSHGADVSQLQQQLKQHGLYNGSIDGIYGPQVQQAVKQFQNMSGIQADGIYGPQTTSVFQNWQDHPIKFTMAEPAIQYAMQNNPNLKATLTAASQNSAGNQANVLAAANFMSKAAASAGAPNPGYLDSNGNVDTDVYQQMALQQLSPGINASLKYYANDLNQNFQNEKAQYASNLAGTQQSIANDNASLQTQQGQNNNVNSGWGATQRQNFQNASNSSLNALQSGAQTTLSGLARNYEQNLGTNALNSSGIDTNMAGAGSVGATGTYNSGQNMNAYTPIGGLQGGLTAQWQSQTANLAKQMQNGAYPQTPAYNQYVASGVLGGTPSSYPYLTSN